MRASFCGACASLAALALAGCAVGPNYKRPSIPVPPVFYGTDPAAAGARTLSDVPWWELFEDPVLNGLIGEALKNGYDARLAAARVEESRALYGVARSDLLPGIGYQTGYEKQKLDQVLAPNQPVLTKWTARVGFQWEIDLWGGIRRKTEAARAQYLASEEARRGVLLSLVTDVATAYFELRELDTELEIATRTTGAFQDTYDLFDRRLRGGAASALETARAEASLGQVAAQIPELERAIVTKENQLNLLLGRIPRPIPRDEAQTPVPPQVPAGLPSTLLERRPDVRQAEQELVAANAGIGAAKADFFPNLNLTGYFGNVSSDLGQIFSKGNYYDFAAPLIGPLFSAGRIKRNYEAAKARYVAAGVQYEESVTRALSEVSGTLVDRTKLVETEKQRARTVNAFQEAVRLAQLRYTSGLSAYFEVLDAQQQLFPAELSLAATHRDQLLAVVALYKALGGGWQAQAAAPTPTLVPASAP